MNIQDEYKLVVPANEPKRKKVEKLTATGKRVSFNRDMIFAFQHETYRTIKNMLYRSFNV